MHGKSLDERTSMHGKMREHLCTVRVSMHGKSLMREHLCTVRVYEVDERTSMHGKSLKVDERTSMHGKSMR